MPTAGENGENEPPEMAFDRASKMLKVDTKNIGKPFKDAKHAAKTMVPGSKPPGNLTGAEECSGDQSRVECCIARWGGGGWGRARAGGLPPLPLPPARGPRPGLGWLGG